MRCHFCFNEGDVPKLSKEHLLSQPVAEAFGVDRSAPFGHLGPHEHPVRFTRLSDSAVRFVCEPCNNTWMNALEHRMATLISWVQDPDRPMTTDQTRVVRSWGLKTYLVLSAMVGETRRFADNPEAPGVIPNFTRARQLFEGDDEAFDGMAFGLARTGETSRFAYAFGNPTVVPKGPRYASQKSTGLAIVAVGPLQLWTVDPTIFHSAQTSFPREVAILRSGMKYRALRAMPLVPNLDTVTVDNGEHDIVDLIDRLTEWAKTQEGFAVSE